MSGTGLAPFFTATDTLAASGSSPSFQFSAPFNLTLSGTWAGTVAVEASVDGGATFVNCVMPDGSPSAFTINGFYPAVNVFQNGVLYRLTFPRTSGTLVWTLSR